MFFLLHLQQILYNYTVDEKTVHIGIFLKTKYLSSCLLHINTHTPTLESLCNPAITINHSLDINFNE